MGSAAVRIEAFFLDGPRGRRFCVFTLPASEPMKGTVLYLHPFAEEMHKSRHMAALQARALAERGYGVLQIDLTGCGDSEGDFGDASWSAWLDDARLGHAFLTRQASQAVVVWGLRSGALLAADLAQHLLDIRHLILWQPVLDGGLFLNQFLRIKLASEMLSDGQSKSGTKALLAELESGRPVEIGGYALSAEMARELTVRKLMSMSPGCPITWIEVGTQESGQLGPASQRVAESWRGAGRTVNARTVKGDPFWSTQEITLCPDLIQTTSAEW
jgi:exosortase A-associated hydrolase 2